MAKEYFRMEKDKLRKKDDIKKELNEFLNAVETGVAEINVMLVNQDNYRKKRYKGSILKTTLDDIKKVIVESFGFLSDEIGKRTIDIYDLEISIDDSVQVVDSEDVIHGKEIIDELTVNYNDENVVTKETDLSKFNFLVIQIFANDKKLYMFKKYIHPSTAYRKSQKFTLSGGLLKPFTKDIITINSYVDAFLLSDAYYILNRNTFNTMFAYKDVFSKILHDNTETIKKSGVLTNTETFLSDCESNGRYLARLTKVILAKGFDEVTEKKDEIPKVIEEFNLSLKTSEDGEIIYDNKESIPEILNLLLRHYVIDALTSNKMIAAAIQEYQAGSKGGSVN